MYDDTRTCLCPYVYSCMRASVTLYVYMLCKLKRFLLRLWVISFLLSDQFDFLYQNNNRQIFPEAQPNQASQLVIRRA